MHLVIVSSRHFKYNRCCDPKEGVWAADVLVTSGEREAGAREVTTKWLLDQTQEQEIPL